MNLGQTLMAILALVLFTIITISINRARIDATTQTIDYHIELEAINYAQSLMEVISNLATTETGFNSITGSVDRQKTFTPGSGRTLYATIDVDQSSGLIKHGISYKKVTVSVYADSLRTQPNLQARYYASFNKWWEID